MTKNIKRQDAKTIIEQFLPIFKYFEKCNIDYCIVGGIAVLIHCYINDSRDYRETMDIDFIISQKYNNMKIAEDYMSIFGKNKEEREKLKLIILGDEHDMSVFDNSFENISIEGAIEQIDGFNTPNVDFCRVLNNVNINTIDRERVSLLGHEVWVATISQLLKMKEDVIRLYGQDPINTSRFHDYIDVKLLKNISKGE